MGSAAGIATTTTTTLLLESLRDCGNDGAWQEFHARYGPIILGVARRLGLGDADAADVAQETLTRFVREYRAGRYDRRRGRLRAWIISLVKYRVADLRRAQAARRERRGHSALVDVPQADELAEHWEAEHRAVLLQRALAELRTTSRVRPRTLAAFEMFVLSQRPAAEVAAALGMTCGDVYMAKNRVAERLRAIVARLEPLYDEGG